MKAVFQEEIRAEKERGRSVLLSSHILSETEALADRISIIRAGRVVESGGLETMRARLRTTVTATLDRAPVGAALDAVHQPVFDGTHHAGTVAPEHLGDVMAALSRAGMQSLRVQPASLEDLFLSHYGPNDAPSAS